MLGFFEDHSVLLNRNSTPTKQGHSGLRWTHFGMFLFSSLILYSKTATQNYLDG